jgi:hypothetical protein
MCHKGFCFLKCFKEQQAMNNENGNLLFGGSENYVQLLLLFQTMVQTTKSFKQWKSSL